MTYGYLRYEGRAFRIKSPSVLHQQDTSYLLQRKLQNPVSKQAQAAASMETANTQPSSDDEQPEPTLVSSPRSSPTTAEVSVTVVTNKGHKRKGRFLKVKEMKFPSVLLLTKAVKGETKTSKFKTVQVHSN